ncbi:FkbM family methyltransferase [Sphingomonas qomolangmaensis]|uniref:FkbM family methyltransferase n=1 Tax=Sphingomonas qomolangmaensis TaxID=2918765 RepID=A0ABY5LBW0_9SPHN|nr:FkbM family methyltransferase [Sphingomonas qomolangmaensis]UUL82171.1 FkbM family methyltransferase [Sphingomonas qomolangmaensis]
MANRLIDVLRLRKNSARRRLARLLPSRHQSGNIFETPNGTFAIPTSDLEISRILRRGQSWGHEEVERICAVVPAGSSVLFVGGHVGTLAVPVARRFKDVTVIEANPETFRFLSANIHLNKADNVTLVQIAAGEKKGVIEFVASKNNTGGSKRKPLVADPRYYYDKPDLISVDMVRLDDILEPRFASIVMDIEGSEYFALRGMPKVLADAQTLFIEFLPHHLENVAGASVEQFYDAIGTAFDHLFVPSQHKTVSGPAVLATLKQLYDGGVGEEVLVFSKGPLAVGIT